MELMNEAALRYLIETRKKQMRQTQLLFLLGVFCILCGVFRLPVWARVLLMLGGVLLCLRSHAWKKRREAALREALSHAILPGLLSQFFQVQAYQPGGHLDPPTIREAGLNFPHPFEGVEGSDYLRADYQGMTFSMSDLSLYEHHRAKEANGTFKWYRMRRFQGLWMICHWGRTFPSDFCVSERSPMGKKDQRTGIKTADPEFDRNFLVTSSDPEAALHSLTPRMMALIQALDQKGRGDLYLRFTKDGTVHIAIDSGRDSFELGPVGSITYDSLEQRFLQEVRYITELLDLLIQER